MATPTGVPLKTTVGQLMINQALPPELRNYGRILDGRGLRALARDIQKQYPEQYRDIFHKLMQIGREAGYRSGGMSFGLQHLMKPVKIKHRLSQIERKVYQIQSNSRLSDAAKQTEIAKLLDSSVPEINDLSFEEAVRINNPLGEQVQAGVRGGRSNLRSLLASDLMYLDHHDRPIPVAIIKSYSQGLSPVEYWAGTYGSRKGLANTKFCLTHYTPILYADYSIKTISEVRPGDQIMGADAAGVMFPVKVSKVFKNGERQCYRYIFRKVGRRKDFLEVAATEDHKILMLAKDGHPSTLLQLKNCKIYDRKDIGYVNTFDLEVDHPDHMFVLGNGLIVSNSTQEAGALSKQLNQVVHRLLVTKMDADDGDKEPETPRGVPVETADSDNEGMLLAKAFGPYKRNSVLTPKSLNDLRSMGFEKILVRSPMVGGPSEGGVYAKDVGIREKGRLPPVGDWVGISAAQALTEPLSQSQLASKHGGGAAGGAPGVSGFKFVKQMTQVPAKFVGGAAHAKTDGKIEKIEEAPAGGHNVYVGGEKHFIGPDFKVNVDIGQEVEAGDVLSNGIPNPYEIVRHKGVGEGRRYFAGAMRNAYRDMDMVAHPKNLALLSRGLIDHVRLLDEYGDYMPDDVVSYSMIESRYKPRPGFNEVSPNKAIGKYLERPVLHYTIGTKVRPSVVRELSDFGVKSISIHNDPPPFEAEMIRAQDNLQHDPDWMTRMLGQKLEMSVLKGVHRGAISDESGTSYVPILAKGVGFGQQGLTTGWRP